MEFLLNLYPYLVCIEIGLHLIELYEEDDDTESTSFSGIFTLVRQQVLLLELLFKIGISVGIKEFKVLSDFRKQLEVATPHPEDNRSDLNSDDLFELQKIYEELHWSYLGRTVVELYDLEIDMDDVSKHYDLNP